MNGIGSMAEVIKWEDFKKENPEYLKNQGMENPSISEAFKLGQLAFIAQIVEIFHCSLTYNGLDWIDEIGKKVEEWREPEADTNEFLYPKGYKNLILKAPMEDFIETDDGRRIKL